MAARRGTVRPFACKALAGDAERPPRSELDRLRRKVLDNLLVANANGSAAAFSRVYSEYRLDLRSRSFSGAERRRAEGAA